jgi:poly-beta-1,6-N-acetyl-D-glucosamine synthase
LSALLECAPKSQVQSRNGKMKFLFWFSLLFTLYAYAGYPFVLYVWMRIRPRPVRRRKIHPDLSIVIAARDEAQVIEKKIKNVLALDYPADRMEVIAVSDGSTDGTDSVLARCRDPRVRAFHFSDHRGKAEALNFAISQARGELIVFTDARQQLDRRALRHLVSNFADPAVGVASGEVVLRDAERGFAKGIGLYWRYEEFIRQCESEIGSVVGASGPFYAMRRHLITTLPSEVILDDVYLPLLAIRKGSRVILDRGAHVFESASQNEAQEFPRKVRTLRGGWQLLWLCPWILSPAYGLNFQFLSHKVSRLLVPWFLITMLVSNCFLLEGWVYVLLAIGQAAFYTLAACRRFLRSGSLAAKLSWPPYVFVVLNAAAIASVFCAPGGKWRRTHGRLMLLNRAGHAQRIV